MPLNCDCYPGCWGDHSELWPEIICADKDRAREVRKRIMSLVPYGSYVSADDCIVRVEPDHFERVVGEIIAQPCSS